MRRRWYMNIYYIMSLSSGRWGEGRRSNLGAYPGTISYPISCIIPIVFILWCPVYLTQSFLPGLALCRWLGRTTLWVRCYTYTWAAQYHIPQCHRNHAKHSWYKSCHCISGRGWGWEWGRPSFGGNTVPFPFLEPWDAKSLAKSDTGFLTPFSELIT